MADGFGWGAQTLIFSGLLAGAGYMGVAADLPDQDETPLAKDEVPAEVLKAAEAEAPGARFLNASTETEHGRQEFELNYELAGGGKLEITAFKDGTILEREQKIEAGALPQSVRDALAMLPGEGEVVSVEKKIVTLYEIKRKSEGKVSEVTFTAGGRKLHDDDDEHEQEDDDDHDHDRD